MKKNHALKMRLNDRLLQVNCLKLTRTEELAFNNRSCLTINFKC